MPYKVVRYLGAGRYVLVAALNVLLLAALCYFYLTEGLSDANHVTASIIVKELRLPRMLCAMGVGASLSVAGALMQGVFRNLLVIGRLDIGNFSFGFFDLSMYGYQ